jgi:hypothetical protein
VASGQRPEFLSGAVIWPVPSVTLGKISAENDPAIREIHACDAKPRLLQILDDIERGETVIIICHEEQLHRYVIAASRRAS